ncbi:MAG: aldehyde dehydrogenase family protein, partial [Jatrophihabitans sp.]
MSLLDTADWDGQIYSGGWREAQGGTRPVVEPATGKQLATVGLAAGPDVARACAAARAAQAGWAALGFQERAAVLRRAGEIIEANADEIHWWIIREAGSVLPKAQLETHVAAQECYEAAALPSHPYGRLLRSEQPRLSLERRIPVGVVGVIAPFNVPLILGIRSVAPALALG